MTTVAEIAGNEAPGFEEPWQAQIYAMSQVLVETGQIAPRAWADALGAAIRERLSAGAPDTPETYFQAVADALEAVLALSRADVTGLTEAWRSAYQATPHGEPVALGRTAAAADAPENR